MKLALICTEKLPSPAIRGGAIQMMIDGVAPFLQNHYQLTVFSITDMTLPNYHHEENIEYIRFPAGEYQKSVAKKLREMSFDIIHVFNRPKNIPLYKMASPSSKLLLGLHNDMLSEEKVTLESGQKIIDSVDHIVTVSNYIKRTVLERFPEATSKIDVVYSGVNLDDYPSRSTAKGKEIRSFYRKKYQLEDKKVILFVGRLTKSKGTHHLITAFKAIAKRHPQTVLVIAGGKWFSDYQENSYIRYLKRLALPIQNRVIFTSFIPAEEIPHIFLMSDIFVCPSQWQEPLARVHYEAFAAELPVVTTHRGGNSEVVTHKENGYVIEHYDQPSEFAKAVHFLLMEPTEAERFVKNAKELVASNFQFHHVADRLLRVYSKVLETEGRGNSLQERMHRLLNNGFFKP